ncbi:aromatic acid exporter family protein [Streptomyces sp. NPDC003077]|uniref:FUSC family protein n=1 Tax=Streptomyces sp. NPDC003077 TaxID=3154443 RepID=UPI0033BA3A48
MHHLTRTITGAARAECAAVLRSARQACAGPGRERDLVAQSLKAALAAVAAWTLSSHWLPGPPALMAPWVAVVLVQATVYRSFAKGLQQTSAIAVGALIATGAALLLGTTAAAMALALPVTLLVGNWPRLGDQGIYSATSALFMLVGGPVTLSVAADRVLAALLGAALGIGVNALIRPPTLLRSARQAVGDTVRECVQILEAVADGLAEPWTPRRVRGWWERARRLPRLLTQVRAALEWSEESARLNPDLRRRAELLSARSRFESALDDLEQVAEHLQGLTRTLLDAADAVEPEEDDAVEPEEDDAATSSNASVGADPQGSTAEGATAHRIPKPDDDAVAAYADFLRQVAAATATYGRTVTGPDGSEARAEHTRAVYEAERTHELLRSRLADRAPADPEALALFGSLLAQARRLIRQLGS